MLVFLLISPGGRADFAPIQFVDVTEKAGIHFRHYSGAKGQYHLPETIGSGGAFFDYDNDEDPDLYLVNGSDWSGLLDTGVPTSVLFRNNSDGTFTDVTALTGIGNQGNYGQ